MLVGYRSLVRRVSYSGNYEGRYPRSSRSPHVKTPDKLTCGEGPFVAQMRSLFRLRGDLHLFVLRLCLCLCLYRRMTSWRWDIFDTQFANVLPPRDELRLAFICSAEVCGCTSEGY
jgi:hypothetical protein